MTELVYDTDDIPLRTRFTFLNFFLSSYGAGQVIDKLNLCELNK